MKKYFILFLSCLCSFAASFAQKAPMKLGDAEDKEVLMTKHDKFPDAEAVVLCDYGSISYSFGAGGLQSNQEYLKRIKIFKKSAYDRANVSIILPVKGVAISNIKGYVYNQEGGKVTKTKMEHSAIIEKKISKEVKEIKFALPNVQEGSVIEYGYDLRSEYTWMVPTWYFQERIPVVLSEYRTKIPQYFEFLKEIQVYQPFVVNYSAQTRAMYSTPKQVTLECVDQENRWVMQDIPAFKDEPFIASSRDHVMKVEFQLAATNYPSEGRKAVLGTWESVAKSLLKEERFGKILQKNIVEKAAIDAIIDGKVSNKEKAVAVYNYVKNNIKFNGKTGLRVRKSFQDIWKKKIGSASEINLLLANLLQSAGLEVGIIASSTRDNGKIWMESPNDDKLNYVTVYAKISDTEEVLLDATEPMLGFGMLSYQALNGSGLLMFPNGKASWIDLQSTAPKMSNITSANLNIAPDGLIKGEVADRFGGYEAIRMRRKAMREQYAQDEDAEAEPEDEEDKAGKEKEEELEKKVNQYTFKNLKDLEKPLDGIKTISTNEFSQLNDDFIYVTPLLDYRMKENPLKSETRNFPIDYACPIEQVFYMTYQVPEGYKVEELPKPLRIMWRDGSVKFDYLIANSEDKIQISSKFVLTRAIFKPEEYKMLRDLYAQIVTKQEEQIVLKKK